MLTNRFCELKNTIVPILFRFFFFVPLFKCLSLNSHLLLIYSADRTPRNADIIQVYVDEELGRIKLVKPTLKKSTNKLIQLHALEERKCIYDLPCIHHVNALIGLVLLLPNCCIYEKAQWLELTSCSLKPLKKKKLYSLRRKI